MLSRSLSHAGLLGLSWAGGACACASAQASVLWMEQAQRLQEVSASLLDTLPVSMPVAARAALGVRADLSFLPSPNPRVGAKNEKLPTAPLQSIPTLFFTAGTPFTSAESVALEAWGGVLPSGGERLFGINASLVQTQWGGRMQLATARLTPVSIAVGAGLGRTHSSLKGTLSSVNRTDSFQATTDFRFAELLVQHQLSGLWLGYTMGTKRTQSRLVIADDATDLELTDTLSRARQPYWSQLTLGLATRGGFSVSLSELMVPDRLEMPRLSVSWRIVSLSGAPRE